MNLRKLSPIIVCLTLLQACGEDKKSNKPTETPETNTTEVPRTPEEGGSTTTPEETPKPQSQPTPTPTPEPEPEPEPAPTPEPEPELEVLSSTRVRAGDLFFEVRSVSFVNGSLLIAYGLDGSNLNYEMETASVSFATESTEIEFAFLHVDSVGNLFASDRQARFLNNEIPVQIKYDSIVDERDFVMEVYCRDFDEANVRFAAEDGSLRSGCL